MKKYMIIIYDGKPTPDDWKVIGEMLSEGLKRGVDEPYNIYWEKKEYEETV